MERANPVVSCTHFLLRPAITEVEETGLEWMPARLLQHQTWNDHSVGGRLVRNAAQLEELYQVNVIDCSLCVRQAIRRMSMLSGGKGSAIVNVSVKAAVLGESGEWIHYASSKGALECFTIGLTVEVGAQGVRVNSVRPAMIDTELQAQGTPGGLENSPPKIPMKRAGTVDEVAQAFVSLMSDVASDVHGTFLDVGDGR